MEVEAVHSSFYAVDKAGFSPNCLVLAGCLMRTLNQKSCTGA